MEKQCKKVSLLGIAILIWAVNLFAQGPDTLWTRTDGGDSTDWGTSVQQTSDGGYIIAGWTNSFGAGRADVYLIKTDALGSAIWTKTYGGDSTDWGFSVQQTSDGGYIVVGKTLSFGAGGADVYLIKTNVKGDTLWTKTYGGTGGDIGRSVQETSDGGYIITGYTSSFGAGSFDVYLIKTDANGDTLWTKTYGETGVDMGYSVQQTSDGGYIIAGQTDLLGIDSDVHLIKTNASGDPLWTKKYGGRDHDYGFSVQQTFDEGYIVVGWTYSFRTGYSYVYLIKTDASGDLLWTKIYGGISDDWGFSVQETSNGGYIVAGKTFSFGAGGADVYLIKTDAKGDILWTETYGGTILDAGYSVQQTSDGGYIITGYTSSFGAGDYDVYLIKTKPPLKLTSPNGGEVLVGNTIHHITWVPAGTDFDSYRLLYSLDGGESYPHIIASRISPNSELYSWRVPEIDCNTCKIKVQIRDMKGRVIVEDESDSNFTIQSTGIEEELLPKTFFVSLRDPNPSQADRTLIKYGLPKSSNVHIVIYNLLGQEVRNLVNKKENAGIHTTIWDGKDEAGERVSSGVYFLRFEAGGYKATRKLLVMR